MKVKLKFSNKFTNSWWFRFQILSWWHDSRWSVCAVKIELLFKVQKLCSSVKSIWLVETENDQKVSSLFSIYSENCSQLCRNFYYFVWYYDRVRSCFIELMIKLCNWRVVAMNVLFFDFFSVFKMCLNSQHWQK